MQLEVYQTDAEAYEAAAELVATRLVTAASRGRATLAVGGGRGARATLLALAGRGEVPWARVTVCLTDERCVAADDARSSLKVVRDSLLAPRGIATDRVVPVPVDAADPAAAYGAALDALAGSPPAIDVVLLEVGEDGGIAAIGPGSTTLDASGSVAAVASADGVVRVTVTPAVLHAAHHVVVTATGDDRAPAVLAALREPVDVARRPAQLVLPSATVTWVVDRAAVAGLLRDAQPAQ